MLRRHAAPLALAVAIALFPLSGATFYVELTAKIMIMAIFALSLDLLVGWTGLVSFGHAAFFGVGAYALAIVAAALCALVVGVFVLRTRGIYFIMVTLAFAQMFYFVFHDTKFGGGSDGRYVNLKPDASILGFTPFDLDKPLHVYYAVFALLIAVWIFLQLLLRSPFGRALQGIRANEQRMRALGFPVTAYKLAAFTLAGAIAGLSGYLLAAQTGFVNPEILSWHQSGNVLLMVILGGAGTPLGPVVGAFALTLMHEFFSSYTRHWQLFLGAAIVLIVLFMPGGLGHLTRRVRRSLFGGTRDG